MEKQFLTEKRAYGVEAGDRRMSRQRRFGVSPSHVTAPSSGGYLHYSHSCALAAPPSTRIRRYTAVALPFVDLWPHEVAPP